MSEQSAHFIHRIIKEALAAGEHPAGIVTRFPPEPNGFLHIGHAKSICLNFETARLFGGRCHLRFDDTNPSREEARYAEAIAEDVRWLGYDWFGEIRHASDYFEQIYQYALQLIEQEQAYVCSLSNEDIREYRGTLTQPGRLSPYRDRSVEENLDLFSRMRAGEFKEGEHVLRAKIDMQAGNLNLRDPIMYRIRYVEHQRTAQAWCIYPMYDFTHCLSDAIEGITHSLCTLEFQDHRPLYDWYLAACKTQARPQQIEFSRLNLSHTVTSKRKLKELVDAGHVSGWDDPRMPTLVGMRRRGYPSEAIKTFCEQVGISKSDSVIELGVLEDCVRATLNQSAPRALCVRDPIKVIIENFPADKTEFLSISHSPFAEVTDKREVPFSREIYIERDDFKQNPPAKYFRLSPGKEVRLRGAYVIRCERVVLNAEGEVTEIICHYDPETLGKNPADRKVKGVIHWVNADTAIPVELRCYDRLFQIADPGAEADFIAHLNPDSLQIVTRALLEPAMANLAYDCYSPYQFERLGYFCQDKTSSKTQRVFNQIVTLRNSWGT